MTAEETRGAWGVEGAYRDAKVPRLLVIRVGPRWYARSVADRRKEAEGWHTLWRNNVPGGIVSIIDAASEAPVVRFGPQGEVAGVLDQRPAAKGPAP